MNVLSLFDGMSCGRIALDRAGLPVTNYYASDIDKYAIQVSKANWPDIEHVGDVTKLEGWYFPKIDLLIGGSPCQGFSFAGKQLNFSDPRSKLFFEFVRLLKQLRERNPKVKFLLENVVMKKEYQDVISEALGVKPVLINSALVSAQNRKRLYWTNIPFLGQPDDKGILLKDILETDGAGFIKNRNTYLLRDSKAMGLVASYFKGVDNHGMRTVIKRPSYIQTDVNKTGHKSATGRYYFVDGKLPTLQASRGESKIKTLLNDKEYTILTPVEFERAQGVADNYTKNISNTQRYKMLGNGWSVDTIVHLFQGLKCDWF